MIKAEMMDVIPVNDVALLPWVDLELDL